MREEIGRRFEEVSFAWGPYLYPDLDDGTTEADEPAAIGAGEISATSFRYVGAVAPGLPGVVERMLAEP